MSLPTSTPSTLSEGLGGWPPPVLDPAGPFSERIVTLWWVLLAMFVLVLVMVLAAIWAALFGPPSLKRRLHGEAAIWIGGVGLPVVVLTALLVWGLALTERLTRPAPADAVRIRVTGEMWWWRVAYLDRMGRVLGEDANEVHIPVGRPVAFELASADVIHSFWIPRLAGKLDMIPGRVNRLVVTADRPGVFAGQCAEYCGGPHALMGFVVVAHEPAAFSRIRAERLAPAGQPSTTEAARGEAVFRQSGCGACHTVRGTEANGLAGPDLTHVGSRRSLGAGILPNNRGVLAGWVANSQDIKPGNRMPPYKGLSGSDLSALSAYLEGLR